MGSTVLVVDDDAGVRTTVARILEDEGYAVTVAEDGLEALAKLDDAFPDAILLDLSMPRMDGWAFVAELKRLGLRTKLPIIIFTADGRAKQKASQIGADGYLAKPFDMLSLLDEVERLTS